MKSSRIHIDCGCIYSEFIRSGKMVHQLVHRCPSHVLSEERKKESSVRSKLESVCSWHEFKVLLEEARQACNTSADEWKDDSGTSLDFASLNCFLSHALDLLLKLKPLYERED